MIKQEINQIKIKRDASLSNRDQICDRLAKVDAELEDLQNQTSTLEKKLAKQEQEKKKAAAAKKFKEAAKA